MPINREMIEARIREINDAIRMLREIVDREYGRLTTHHRLAMRYLVIQLVEAASSVCVHILMAAFNEKPEGFPECFLRLGEKGVLPGGLAERLASAARLRNLLVHRYWTIQDEKVFSSLKGGLGDFEEFVARVRDFLEESGGPGP